MQRRLLGLVVCGFVLFGAAACSDSGGGVTSDLADMFMAEAADSGEELERGQAECLAKLVIGIVGEDTARAAIDAGEDSEDVIMEEAFTALSQDEMEKMFEDMEACVPGLFDMGEAEFQSVGGSISEG